MSSLRTELWNVHCTVLSNHRKRSVDAELPNLAPGQPLQLPPHGVCEKLAELYFDNMEHCFRILHFPSFKAQLDIFFHQGEHACKFGFLPQLVGALAVAMMLGTHPECQTAAAYPVVRPSNAIHLMKTFLQDLPDNDKYLLPVLQVKMLYLICRWLHLDRVDDLFHLSGDLLRDALVMKMDKDPTTLPDITIFEGELRRRAWMTIIEVDLMLSLLCNMPCLVPAYNSQPPRNVNDEDIFEGMVSLPASRPTTNWTNGICQYLLAQTFPRRVAACSEVDKAESITAQLMLPHIQYLEQVLLELPPPMRFNYLGDKASKTPARLMARMELDISIRRPLMHLYSRGLQNCADADVQQQLMAGFLQSCLMIVNYQDLFDPQYSELDVPWPQGYWDFFYCCYRQELGQATLGICLMIQHLVSAVRDSGSSADNNASSPNIAICTNAKGPSYNRDSLITATRDTLDPMRRRLPFRGSQLKDVVFYEIILASIIPRGAGLQIEDAIIKRLQDLVHECRSELKKANVPALVTPMPESLRSANGSMLTSIGVFDPLWQGFPSVSVLEITDMT
jgi:hypothetical protein